MPDDKNTIKGRAFPAKKNKNKKWHILRMKKGQDKKGRGIGNEAGEVGMALS